jgi:urea ABC transporter ATP-binding protein UrtE
MTDLVCSIRDLTSGYGATTVLWNLGLDIPRGEVVAMVGRNGMGKTTTIRTIMGYNPLKSGSIMFNGREIGSLQTSKRARLGIGYVPQGRQLFPGLTVEENLRMGEYVAADKAQRSMQFERVYDMFPIVRERRLQKGGTLSGGQQQMVAIGRALVGQPDLLLLDEPSEGLQPSIIGEVEQHILTLKREFGLTIFLVEQDVQLIKTVADRCYVLEHGTVTTMLERHEFAETDRLEECLAL